MDESKPAAKKKKKKKSREVSVSLRLIVAFHLLLLLAFQVSKVTLLLCYLRRRGHEGSRHRKNIY
jgi:hypothetical protein